MSGQRRVVITGLGVAAGNGADKETFARACREGSSGLKTCTVFPGEKLRTDQFGEVPGERIREPDEAEGDSRAKSLLEPVLEEVYRDAGRSREWMEEQGSRSCLCLGTLLSATEHALAYARREGQGKDTDGWLEHSVDYVSWLAEKSGVRGGVYVDSAACASATTSLGMACDFIKNGIYDQALAGGVDPLLAVSAFGFHALQSLSRGICSPFDERRDGINIGEGAALFLLETSESAKKRGAAVYGEVLGYGLNNDAFHMTRPDPEGAGAYASMAAALREGQILPEQVDYINAHGTGTPVNDIMELKAILRLTGHGQHTPAIHSAGALTGQEQRAPAVHSAGALTGHGQHAPAVNSTKALIGHCMGASGAIELAALLLQMRDGVCYPMPNLKTPMKEAEELAVRPEPHPCRIRYALSNSFAFAGNTASILIGAYET